MNTKTGSQSSRGSACGGGRGVSAAAPNRPAIVVRTDCRAVARAAYDERSRPASCFLTSPRICAASGQVHSSIGSLSQVGQVHAIECMTTRSVSLVGRFCSDGGSARAGSAAATSTNAIHAARTY